MPTFLRDLLRGAVVGFVTGMALSLGHFAARFLLTARPARPEYDVAAAALLVEVAVLTAMGLAVGGVVGVSRLVARLTGPQVVLVIGMTLALLGARVALGLGARASTLPNRLPVRPDEPVVVLAALAVTVAVYLLGRALMARTNRVLRILLPLVGVSLAVSHRSRGGDLPRAVWGRAGRRPRLEVTARRWGVASGAGAGPFLLKSPSQSVSFTDQQVGRLFEQLQQSGAWDSIIVVVLADHGQSLGENDLWFHNSRVTQAMSAIPRRTPDRRARSRWLALSLALVAALGLAGAAAWPGVMAGSGAPAELWTASVSRRA